jgi:hypothetical protein
LNTFLEESEYFNEKSLAAAPRRQNVAGLRSKTMPFALRWIILRRKIRHIVSARRVRPFRQIKVLF